MPARRALLVVGELDGNRYDQVQLGEAPTGPDRSGSQRLEEGVGSFWHETVAQPPVGQLAGQLEVLDPHGSDVDRDARRPGGGPERPPDAVGKG